jgi:hypothetical protein
MMMSSFTAAWHSMEHSAPQMVLLVIHFAALSVAGQHWGLRQHPTLFSPVSNKWGKNVCVYILTSMFKKTCLIKPPWSLAYHPIL